MEVGREAQIAGRVPFARWITLLQVAIARGNEVFDDLLAKAAADMIQALKMEDDE